MKKIYPFIFALVFWGISITPLFKPDVSIGSFENNFLGHNALIEAFNTLRMRLGDRVFPNVIVGKDGWLFYTADRSIDDYQGTNVFSNGELIDYQKRFDALYEKLQQKSIMLVVIIAPDKNTIYPEYMPDQITKTGDQSRLDEFVEYMRKYGKTPVIDLRPDLLEASKTKQVYYKTDTHWNALGEYIAYAEIMSTLSQRYPELISHPLSEYEAVHAGLITHDIPQILGTPMIREDYWNLQPKFDTGTNTMEIPLSDRTNVRFSWNQNQNLPSALIYHDSFFLGVVPLLEPHFKQTTSIPRTNLPGIWDINWIDQVHPDVVIFESVERFLNVDNYVDFIK